VPKKGKITWFGDGQSYDPLHKENKYPLTQVSYDEWEPLSPVSYDEDKWTAFSPVLYDEQESLSPVSYNEWKALSLVLYDGWNPFSRASYDGWNPLSPVSYNGWEPLSPVLYNGWNPLSLVSPCTYPMCCACQSLHLVYPLIPKLSTNNNPTAIPSCVLHPPRILLQIQLLLHFIHCIHYYKALTNSLCQSAVFTAANFDVLLCSPSQNHTHFIRLSPYPAFPHSFTSHFPSILTNQTTQDRINQWITDTRICWRLRLKATNWRAMPWYWW